MYNQKKAKQVLNNNYQQNVEVTLKEIDVKIQKSRRVKPLDSSNPFAKFVG